MSNSRWIRVFVLVCVCMFSILALVACESGYRFTGKELNIEVSASPSTVKQAGQVISYTYVVRVYVKQSSGHNLPMMTIAVTDSPLDGPVVCPKTVLEDRDMVTCTATYTVTEVDVANGGVTDSAMVTGRFTIAGITLTPTATASVFVPAYGGESSSAVEPTSADEPSLFALPPTAGPLGPTGALMPTNVPSVLALPTPQDALPLFALPILTGDVTFCDPATHVMNLRFVPGFDPQNFNHQVTIGGVVMECEVNPSNRTLLSCKYPVSTVFPAAIQVMLDGVVMNEFVFDGEACTEGDQSDVPSDPGPVCSPFTGCP